MIRTYKLSHSGDQEWSSGVDGRRGHSALTGRGGGLALLIICHCCNQHAYLEASSEVFSYPVPL